MVNKEQQLQTQSEDRFKVIVFFLRSAGLPFHMKKISIISHIYILAVVLCSCTTFVGMLADVYIHMDDLGHIMTSTRSMIPLMDVLFLYFYCR
jgi:hypothetical protein